VPILSANAKSLMKFNSTRRRIAQMRKISAAQVIDKLVRPERFELPASWFVVAMMI